VLLQQPVAGTVIGTHLAILAPVLGMLVLPVALAVSLVGLVIGISGHFVALPAGFSGPLAGLVGTEPLVLDPGIRQKTTAAMGTADGTVHGFLLREATTLAKRPQRGRIRTTTKADAEGKAGNRDEISGEEKPRGRFSERCPWFTFSPVILAHILGSWPLFVKREIRRKSASLNLTVSTGLISCVNIANTT
jgi:hypothetical protein